MTNDIGDQLGRGLRELADVPVPTGLAEGALDRARRTRRRYAFTSGLAAVVATGAIAVPFVLFSGDGTAPAQFGAAPKASPSPLTVPSPSPLVGSAKPGENCGQPPSTTGGSRQAAPDDWPEYARIAMNRLPKGKNWVLQSAQGPCRSTEPDVSNAYSVIDLGVDREDGGHLTLNLADEAHHQLPQNCASVQKVAAKKGADGLRYGEVVACTEGTAGTPLFYAIHTTYGELHAIAVWADGRAVWMESIPNPGEPQPLGLNGLRKVVTDQELVDQLG